MKLFLKNMLLKLLTRGREDVLWMVWLCVMNLRGVHGIRISFWCLKMDGGFAMRILDICFGFIFSTGSKLPVKKVLVNRTHIIFYILTILYLPII